MPTTITISDPRVRTRMIVIDLVDPMHYRIAIERETVREVGDNVFDRTTTRVIERGIMFAEDGTPSGDPLVLALLQPIQQAVELMAQADGESSP